MQIIISKQLQDMVILANDLEPNKIPTPQRYDNKTMQIDLNLKLYSFQGHILLLT